MHCQWCLGVFFFCNFIKQDATATYIIYSTKYSYTTYSNDTVTSTTTISTLFFISLKLIKQDPTATYIVYSTSTVTPLAITIQLLTLKLFRYYYF